MTNKTFEQLLGEKIRRKRNQLSKSQADIEFDAAISSGHLGLIENGKTCPALYTFYKLCDVLQLDATIIFQEIKNEMNHKNKE